MTYTGDIGDGYITIDNGHLNVWAAPIWIDVGKIVGYSGSAGYIGADGYIGSIGYSGSIGPSGSSNLDGGIPTSNYGGIPSIDGGGVMI
jgi:hypothetical protein